MQVLKIQKRLTKNIFSTGVAKVIATGWAPLCYWKHVLRTESCVCRSSNHLRLTIVPTHPHSWPSSVQIKFSWFQGWAQMQSLHINRGLFFQLRVCDVRYSLHPELLSQGKAGQAHAVRLSAFLEVQIHTVNQCNTVDLCRWIQTYHFCRDEVRTYHPIICKTFQVFSTVTAEKLSNISVQ